MQKAKIIGTGSYLPKKILTNQDLEKIVDTSDEWIFSRTGIKERRIAAEGEHTSHMGTSAALLALEETYLNASQIDCIIVATLTPDYVFPSTACIIQQMIGAKNAAAFDIQAACSGYLYALSIAKGWVESGMYKHILVIASEKLSSITDYQDRSTCVLFGDGAAAAVVSLQGDGLTMEAVKLGADGEQAELLMLPGGGCRNPSSSETIEKRMHYIKMSGNEVFKHAVRRMESASKECLEEAGIPEQEISWVIPHQANIRILDAMGKRFEHLAQDRIFKTVQKYGNTSASSLGIALDEWRKQGLGQKGDKILLTAFGGGFTWGAMVLSI